MLCPAIIPQVVPLPGRHRHNAMPARSRDSTTLGKTGGEEAAAALPASENLWRRNLLLGGFAIAAAAAVAQSAYAAPAEPVAKGAFFFAIQCSLGFFLPRSAFFLLTLNERSE